MKQDLEHRRFLRRLEDCDKMERKLLRMRERPEFDAMLAKYERMVKAL